MTVASSAVVERFNVIKTSARALSRVLYRRLLTITQ